MDEFKNMLLEKHAEYLTKSAIWNPVKWYKGVKNSTEYAVKKNVGKALIGTGAVAYGAHRLSQDPQPSPSMVPNS